MSDSFIIYTSYLKIFEQLTDAQLGQLTRHMLSFAKTGEEPNIEDPIVKLSFAFIKDDMERNKRKYEEKCERLRANARKRWDNKKQLDAEAGEGMQKHTDVCKSMQMHTNAQIAMHNDNDNDNDNVVSKETDNKPSKEGIKSASVKPEAPGGGKGSKSQKIDYAAVKEYWNRKHDETKSAMPPITLMTENRKVMVKARVRQCKGDVKTLYRVIDIAMASDFMNGNNKHGWLGKFDWIFGNEQNFAKVLEGNFNNEPAAAIGSSQGAGSCGNGKTEHRGTLRASQAPAASEPAEPRQQVPVGNPAESRGLEEEPKQQASQGFADKILRTWSSAAAGHRLEARKITDEGKNSRSGTFSRFGR